MMKLPRGYIMLLALVFGSIFLTVGTAFVGQLTAYIRLSRTELARAEALALAEGALNLASEKLNENSLYMGETATALGPGSFTISVTPVDASNKRVTATGFVPDNVNPVAVRTIVATIGLSNNVVSFHYGVQAGEGGFSLQNSSSIIGNVYANGPVIGSSQNMIYGDVVSAGPSGLVYGIHATSSVFAHTIGKAGEATIIDKNAYYATSKVNTTVGGTSFPGSPDQSPAPLPITDAQVIDWENQAEAGGVISTCNASGDYVITTSMTLGPKKILCNLLIKSTSGVLTVAGPIWVVGNITAQTGPTIQMDPSLGSQNVAIIADNPNNTTGSGLVNVGQSTVFKGSGSPNSFVFLISQNNSAELGGTTAALTMGQGASALVAYASHGLAVLQQSVNLKEVTAFQINLTQSASVTYDRGLPNTVFESGPGASWAFVPGSYAITR
ncbi:MAG TPA: hypothetical protein VFP46_00610 [Candidatus Paceibacterota bacterium]|nr:hypothetical protein [Candidatus Paceibacterota bacterium]